MFKLLIILCAYVAYTMALSEGSYTISSINSKSAASPTLLPLSVQTNAVSDEDESSEDAADDEPTSPAPAPAPVPAAVTRLSASSSASGPIPATLSASARSNSVLLSASVNSLPPTVSIQHHVLPAEAIPLPITVSTRSGIRTVIAPETITINEPTVAKVGEVVQKIPTAVSHQSQTVVHKHARVVTPIVAPAVRTITSQVLRAYHTPLVLTPQSSVVRVINN